MVSVHDVARYLLRTRGPMSIWKLQKLVYYSQAWHYTWERERLYREPVMAWRNGPVVVALLKAHRDRHMVRPSHHALGTLANLRPAQRESIDAVADFYGEKSGHWLGQLALMEDPWRLARKGLLRDEQGRKQITLPSMARYYAAL